MKDKKVKQLVLAAVLAALTCVGTMVIKIPTLHGYLHPGDGFVLLSGFLLGPWYGAAAAGIGSGLSDLFAGYTIYAPGTLVIKGVTALVAALIYQKKKNLPMALLGGVVGELVMAAGYFLYESAVFGEGAAAAIPGNLVQGAAGVIISLILLPLLKKAASIR
ncbi:MAG: energy coupling factor transporter S component ThiW [Clostridia bacterium]|nr:energy coupling factor transporter S component ThiW [Clostridia bacterium]